MLLEGAEGFLPSLGGVDVGAVGEVVVVIELHARVLTVNLRESTRKGGNLCERRDYSE